jgi:hypothetical protein
VLHAAVLWLLLPLLQLALWLLHMLQLGWGQSLAVMGQEPAAAAAVVVEVAAGAAAAALLMQLLLIADRCPSPLSCLLLTLPGLSGVAAAAVAEQLHVAAAVAAAC